MDRCDVVQGLRVFVAFLNSKSSAGDEDGNSIELAFSKKRIDDRKEWLTNFVPGTYLDQSAGKITYSDFINKVSSSLR